MPPSQRSRSGRILTWALLAVAAFGVFAVAWLGFRGAAAAEHLRQAKAAAAEISTALTSGTADIGPLVQDLVTHADAAHDLTDDIVWRGAEVLPWLGPQLDAVGVLAEGVDILAQDVLLPLSGMVEGGGIEAFLPQDGRIPVDRLVEIAAVTPAALESAERVQAMLAEVDPAPLLGVVRREFRGAQESVDTVTDLIGTINTTARLLPPMLGSDGARNYLVVVQNNAELRSLGGMPGAMVHLRADDGRLSLVDHFTARDFAVQAPVGALPPELDRLYKGPTRLLSAVTQVPEFPVTAELIQGFWNATQTGPLDGVVMVDPVALSYLLRATGPVGLADGTTLTSTTVVPTLLNDVYLNRSAAEQDAYFAESAAAVFTALTAGSLDNASLLSAWEQAVQERRLLVWSDHEEQQQILAAAGLSGALPADNEFGVYLNDGTGSKMDYYLDATAEIVQDPAVPGRQELVVRLAGNAPADVAGYPAEVTGGGNYGVPAGITRTVVFIYLPTGTEPVALHSDGFASFTSGTHDGRDVLVTWADLEPGGTAEARVAIPLADGPASVLMTPQSR